jgi:hypothetical protein
VSRIGGASQLVHLTDERSAIHARKLRYGKRAAGQKPAIGCGGDVGGAGSRCGEESSLWSVSRQT